MVFVTGTLVPLAFEAVSVIVYVPGTLYETAVFGLFGFPPVTAGGTPPKFQLHVLGEFVAEPFNETASGAQPERGVALIETTGTCA